MKEIAIMNLRKCWFVICLLLAPSLVFAAEYSGGVQAKVILKASTTGNGVPIAYLKTDQPEITAMTVDILPGAQTGWHSHPIPVYAYVMSGCLTVFIEGTISPRTFNAGDIIIEVVNARHNGINEGKDPVKLIVFYTGAKNIPNVIKTVAP
jgi:quercetin dioxygenase-like cupin family protein